MLSQVGNVRPNPSFLAEANQDEDKYQRKLIITSFKPRQNANNACDHRRSNPELAEKYK